jgi:hypothetical protein
MIKKLIILSYCSLFVISKSQSQDISLSIDNLRPRVNQIISINLSLDFIKEVVSTGLDKNFRVIQGTSAPFSVHIFANDTGKFYVGPYEMVFNNKVYKTDSVLINVLKALPPKDTICISTYFVGNKQYILLEQLYELKIEFGQNYYANKPNLVELKDRFNGSYSFQEKGAIDELYGSKSPKPLHYSYKIYDVVKYSKNEITLTNSNFDNLPKGFVLPLIILK